MESSVKKVFDKDTSFRTLEIVNSWIVAADNKSSILIAFVGLIVGLTADTYGQMTNLLVNGSSMQIALMIIFGLMYLSVLILVIYHLISVFVARIKNQDIFPDNLISFVSISNKTADEYIEKAEHIEDKKMCEMILSQVNINSKIALNKMKHFNHALKFGILLIPLTIIIMIIVG
ncbi:MAG: hypothetical protein RBQ97_11375 [Acholeplasma sp.]|jgi:hypothetical protein|nr:hypothetical protein [Acholeplasma sp.]